MQMSLPDTGKAWSDKKALLLIICIYSNLLPECGSWADNGHITLDDIEKLRKLIDAGLSDEAADTGYPRVILHLEHRTVLLILVLKSLKYLFCIDDHGTELVHLELPSIPANPDLLEDRTALRVVNEYCNSNYYQKRRKNDYSKKCSKEINTPLDEAIDQLPLKWY